MPLIKWITKSEHPYDSFYYYNSDTLAYVLVRLELDRQGATPDPGVFSLIKRYVGFISSKSGYDFNDSTRWTVNASNHIVYKKEAGLNEVLPKEPQIGHIPVNFTLSAKAQHPRHIHISNEITANYSLPVNSKGQPVTTEILDTIAKGTIGRPNAYFFCSANANSKVLADNIFLVYNEYIAGKQEFSGSIDHQFAEATTFFNTENLKLKHPPIPDEDPYANKYGLNEFIAGTELIDEPEIMVITTALKDYMIILISIVTDYVNRYSAAYGEEYKTDPDLWQRTISNLPLVSVGRFGKRRLLQSIRGVDIPSYLVYMILDLVPEKETPEMEEFFNYLQTQSEDIQRGIEEDNVLYPALTIGITVDIIRLGEEYIYIPKIKQFKTNFDKKNSGWTTSCCNEEHIDVDLEYQFTDYLFNYEALEDPEIRKYFDEFIERQRKAPIEKASTFFNHDFLPEEEPE